MKNQSINRIAVISLFVYLQWAPTSIWSQNLELHFLDVHQGDSTLVVCPNGNRILVDAGDSVKIPAGNLNHSQIGALRGYVLDNLRSPKGLEYLVVTHGDSDHFRLLNDLLSDVDVNTIVYGGFYNDYPSRFREWLSSKPKGLLVSPVGSDLANSPNGYFDCGPADVWILASNTPHKNKSWKENTRSLVLKITYRQFDAILAGDATFETEEAIRASYEDSFLDVELLKLGHHGSRSTSSSKEWVWATKPEIAVASAARGLTSGPTKDRGNKYGHLAKDVLDLVRPCTARVSAHSLIFCDGPNNCEEKRDETRAVYSTASSGTVVVTSNGWSWKVSEDGENHHTPTAIDSEKCGSG